MYSTLSGIITDYSQVSDAGLAHAETWLPPAQLQQVLQIASFPRYTGPDTRATQDNLLNGQQPGGPLWSLVHESIGVTSPKPGGISFADAIVQYPQLTGLFVAYELFGVTSGAPSDIQAEYSTPDALMTLATTRVSQQGRFQTSVAYPDNLSADAGAAYLGWVAHYLNAIFAETPQAIAGERDALVYMVLAYARQAAMARGITTLDMTGSGGNKIDVATELIHLNLELPDGTRYVVMDDVTGDPANRYVYQWYGPNYRPQAFGPNGGATERMGVTTCVDIIKGTGPWYTARVFGLVAPGSSCDATPDDFTGPWDLITKDISDALTYQSGAPVVVVPPEQQVTNIPTPTTVTYHDPIAPIPTPAPSPGGSGGGQVSPSVNVVPYTGPSPILLQPTPTQAQLPAPSVSVQPLAGDVSSTGMGLGVALLGGFLAAMLLKKGRR